MFSPHYRIKIDSNKLILLPVGLQGLQLDFLTRLCIIGCEEATTANVFSAKDFKFTFMLLSLIFNAIMC